MLPNTSSTSSSIHINPKFRNVHINPNFLSKSNGINHQSSEPAFATAPTQIYINPRFLGNVNGIAMTHTTNSTQLAVHPSKSLGHEFQETMSLVAEPLADTKIHSRTKVFNSLAKPIAMMKIETAVDNIDRSKSLIKIGSKKLVRVPAKSFAKISKAIPKVRRPLQTKYKIVKEQTAFKIDRRSSKDKLAAVTRKTVPLVSSRKLWINESLIPSKTINRKIVSSSLVDITAPVSTRTLPKAPILLNINGILYKSNRRKLEKTTISSQYSLKKGVLSPTAKLKQSYRRLTVRGENFLLDASGKNLIRVLSNRKESISSPTSTPPTPAIIKRIDIGKITFVKKSNDTYERTDYHKSRYHLNIAKQRSIQTLTNRLVKTNVPCPIYRKLGKCAAFVRGKCTKLHDNKLVDVCPRFLKGTCDKKPCLLSHDTTLSKMPTCKFYLQGICFKSDCPYLHKKMSYTTEICVDFLRGFCEKAEQCTKRHEFLCPEQQSKGSCKLTRCPYPHRMVNIRIEESHIERPDRLKVKRKSRRLKPETEATTSTISSDVEKLSVKRYFDDESKQNMNQTSELITSSESENQNSVPSTENIEQIIVVRKPILGSLPSFIPIG